MTKGSKDLVYIPQLSTVTLPEVWQMTGIAMNSSLYVRSEMIDKWDWWTPEQVKLNIKDFHGKDLSLIRLDSTDSTNNLTDLLSYHRQDYMKPFSSATPYKVYIENDGDLILADPNDISLVYLAHIRHNSTSTLNCFTKTGVPFSVLTATTTLQNQMEIIYTKQFVNQSGITELTITLFNSASFHYMNGISVYNHNNTEIKYKVGYTEWYGSCQKGFYTYIVDTYAYKCDGSLQHTGNISNVKASCVWIFFNESVKNVTVKIAGPAEDFVLGNSIQVIGLYGDEPTTLSVSTSTTYVDTSPVAVTEHGTDSSAKLTSFDVNSVANHNLYVSKDSMCDPCTCIIYNTTSTELSETEIKQIKDKIKTELFVDKQNLSSTIRKKTCADDPRTSSTGIGYVGACIIAITFGLVTASDFISVFQYLIRKQISRG